MIIFAIGALEGVSYAQFSVSITGPGYASTAAPSGSFTVSATVTGNANLIVKVVFYRNDVPYKTDTSSPFQLSQNQLGQDTYTYRARAYDSTGVSVDSSDVKLAVTAPQVVKMGQTIGGIPTTGPSRTQDHTAQIQAAVNWLGANGGGTLLFPCKVPAGDSISVYNIKSTITVPSNVTLQGESAEQGVGRCRIYWIDAANQGGACADNPGTLLNKPVFRLEGGTSRVRFKDLWLWSLSAGIECWPRGDYARIAAENTSAIEMNNKDYSGNIRDVIFENVSIESFTYGIKAISNNSAENDISDIKIRAYRPVGNHRQLYIDAKYAYDWDVQNLNISHMLETQGAVEIVNAGKPASPIGENTKLKFLQINCNATRSAPPAFCVQVEKHGGLYFRQLHHEGTNQAIIVKDISGRPSNNTNPDPIVFESGAGTGTFNDASMKLYLIGNALFAAPEIAQAGLDDGRLRFVGAGVNSTVVDCGDIHWDVTDTDGDPNDPPAWEDFGMYFSHSERNRGSFFAEDSSGNKFIKPHTICPQGVSGLANINEVGGEYFDSGVMPTEAGTYSNELNSTTCPSPCNNAADVLEDLMDRGGTVYINGSYTLNHTVTLRTGSQIVGALAGASNSELTLSGSDTNLFQINAPVGSNELPRTSGIVIRDLTLKTTGSGKTGIAIVGDSAGVGGASDLHFSGLKIEGFDTGVYVRPTSVAPLGHQPMVDGLSLKHSSFVSNQTAVRNLSANASNWNIMNLKVTSGSTGARGWDQKGGGNQSLQNVTCQGSPTYPMLDCIRLSITGTYLAGLKQTDRVTNALTIFESILTHIVVRDSDFRSSLTTQSRMNLLGRAFIVSMNNKYDDFNVQNPYSEDPLWRGDYSRLTYCGDTYSGGVYTGTSNGLAERHPNLIVGAPTLTRVPCGTRPIPWDDAIRLGGTSADRPLVGNFFADVREDFVIYREGTTSGPQSSFLIKQAGGTGNSTISWGLKDDIPMIGRFFPNSRAQIVVWRPSDGDFWAYDPNTATYFAYHWGQTGDIPFVGNFLDESGSVSGNKDEVAVYRSSTKAFYISNPRSGTWTGFTTTPDTDSKIQVGDFWGLGYDQIAQVKADSNNILKWHIVNPRTGSTSTVNFGQAGDVPVAGKYLSGACTQVGVWRPSSQEFLVADPPFTGCGTRSTSMIWGSNNDYGGAQYADDIPLTINTADGSLRRPTAYRPTTGAFPYSISNGQWWVHDPF